MELNPNIILTEDISQEQKDSLCCSFRTASSHIAGRRRHQIVLLQLKT